MGNIKWSDELQEKTLSTIRRRRCCIACTSLAAGSVVATGIGLLVVWSMFGVTDDKAVTVGQINGANFTAADWERVISESEPIDMAKELSYQLVTFTDNYEEYLSAMGTSQSLMWMAKAFDERFSTSEVAADGVLTWRWKLTWKWLEILERKWKFKLGEEFATTFGKDLGDSVQTCVMIRPNAMRCEEQHEKHLSWRVITTFEFHHLGLIRTQELPYKDDLVVKKFYQRLLTQEELKQQQQDSGIEASSDQDYYDEEDFWNIEDDWDDDDEDTWY